MTIPNPEPRGVTKTIFRRRCRKKVYYGSEIDPFADTGGQGKPRPPVSAESTAKVHSRRRRDTFDVPKRDRESIRERVCVLESYPVTRHRRYPRPTTQRQSPTLNPPLPQPFAPSPSPHVVTSRVHCILYHTKTSHLLYTRQSDAAKWTNISMS